MSNENPVKKLLSENRGFLVLFSILTTFYFWGVGLVPFHPDEVHLLFQSQDYESILNEPFSLVWERDTQPDYYRSTVAPLPKYLIGFGRSLAGFPAVEVSEDWNWSASWEVNIERGAMPSTSLLISARIAATTATLVGIFFLYLSARQLRSNSFGLLVVFLIGTNALVMLHGRRAMAEGIVIFGLSLSIWGILQADKRPWLTALCIAVAINSKHSTLALVPIGIIAVAWPPNGAILTGKNRISNLLKYTFMLLGATYLLNPFIWKHPFEGVQTMAAERQAWVQTQLDTLKEFDYLDTSLQSSPERYLAILANLFITPPSYWDIGNYSQDTLDSEINYQNIPGHALTRGIAVGGIAFTLTIFGILIAVWDIIRNGISNNRGLVILLLATAAQFITLGISVFLTWQRFIIPLIPFTSLWAAYGLANLITTIQQRNQLQ
ncbi:MAG: hypothetical protein FVQ83_07945 [Chloroflexi bacterium]|nr:hypothetical protein [Chloroflexota bacterium]